MIEVVLAELGVRITNVSDKEIQAYCPVHHLVEGGGEQHAPKWYMNRETGAWICFTCGQRGGLPYLVEALGGDADTVESLKLSAALTTSGRWVIDSDGEEVEERVLIDPVLFDANPRPPIEMQDEKDVSPDIVARYNVRWDARKKCWLLPIYTFDNELAGWQEKSKGYFNNVPKRVKKAKSLFGWHTYQTGRLIVVESPLDALRIASYGHACVATYGSHVSASQFDRIKVADQVLLAFDNDDAGDHATEHMSELLSIHPYLRRFKYPPLSRGSDPGELTPSQLEAGIQHATLSPPPKKEEEEWKAKKKYSPKRTKKMW
jgi:hypothetical protein